MTTNNSVLPENQPRYEHALRAQLAMLRARYDDGAVSVPVYAVIRAMELEISWLEHQRVRS
jgi:hypothetical protein